MYSDILQFAVSVATDAGKILLDGFRNSKIEISYKSRTNLVTNMDKKSEDFLYHTIQETFPEHAILAEEGSRKDTDNEFIWLVDPLDGTNNYAHGLPFFAVSLGVYSNEKQEVIAGVVYNPYLNELFTAEKYKGATYNGSKIQVSNTKSLGISVLATGFPYDKHDNANNNTKEFNNILPHIQGIRRYGAAAIDLAYVSSGWLDGYWEKSLHPWDIAAGMLIAKEAGAIVTDYNGNKTNPFNDKIVASNPNIHNAIISVLSK